MSDVAEFLDEGVRLAEAVTTVWEGGDLHPDSLGDFAIAVRELTEWAQCVRESED